MNDTKICFIGCGNMGRSLIGGLAADRFPLENIHVIDPNQSQLDALRSRLAVTTAQHAGEELASADVVVLAVKPQILEGVARDLAPALPESAVVVSIAAGIPCRSLEHWLGEQRAIVRAMPNTPSLVGSGATGLFANARVSELQASQAEAVMRAAGLTLWVDDEDLMDAVTAVSGSGPAYFFLMMEAMQDAGEALGLNSEQARLLVQQTALGAAKMAMESADDPATLRQQVTSPGGTTERAIGILQQGGYEALVAKALAGAATRARELAATNEDS